MNRYKWLLITFFTYAALTILISSLLPLLQKFIFTNLTVGIYDYDFWKDFLVSLHSSFVDFLILTIAFSCFRNKIDKRVKHEDILNELKLYCDYKEDISLNFKKVKMLEVLSDVGKNALNIPRIKLKSVKTKKMKVYNSNLQGMTMKYCNLKEMELKNNNMRSLDLSESKLNAVRFNNCLLKNVKMINVVAKNTHFINCDMNSAKIINAEMKSCIFDGCDLSNAEYAGSNLRSANFLNAINIDEHKLSKAHCIDYIKIDISILNRLKKLAPNMKFSDSK